jgi:hypothetical protein
MTPDPSQRLDGCIQRGDPVARRLSGRVDLPVSPRWQRTATRLSWPSLLGHYCRLDHGWGTTPSCSRDLWKDFKQDHTVAASRRDTHINEEFHGRNFRYGLLNVTMTTGGSTCREEISSDSG